MVSEHDHIYGTKGITSVMVTETTAEKDDSTKTITLSVTVTDSKNVLMKAESNSLKVVIPDKNANPKVTINGSNMKYEPLSSTNYRFTALSKATSYSFTIKFELSNDDYASEYKSFAKYFIDHEYDGSDEATLRSATFKDSKDPPFITRDNGRAYEVSEITEKEGLHTGRAYNRNGDNDDTYRCGYVDVQSRQQHYKIH